MKQDEAQERPKTPEAPGPSGVPAVGTTQQLSRAEILAYLERTKKEDPDPDSRRPGKSPARRG